MSQVHSYQSYLPLHFNVFLSYLKYQTFVTKVKWNLVEIILSYEISLLIARIKNTNLLIRIAWWK